jgi:glutaconate CoA-transferase subunit B
MVISTARRIRDGEIVNVGMGLPLLAFALAKRLYAPNAIGFFDAGIVKFDALEKPIFTMCDPPNVKGKVWCTSMINLMHLMQKGIVDLGILGGAEVDIFGNINSSYIGDIEKPKIRLPGSGGASDIAGLAKRLIIMMKHERRRLVESVSYITSLGYGRDGLSREKFKLWGGPTAIVTDMGIFEFDQITKKAILTSIHPGISLEQVKEKTGFKLIISDNLKITEPPSKEELEVLRELDPSGYFTRRNDVIR